MEENIRNVIEKISSYNIFNNLFPGIVFVYIMEKSTKFSLLADTMVEKLFVYYFVGMVISRIGSIIIEKILLSIKVKNKESGKKVPLIERATYNDYIQAAENNSFIKTLNETNNMYRTMISLFSVFILIKLFEWFAYDYIMCLGELGKNIVYVLLGFALVVLFVFSYKKQSDYIRKYVENNNKSKNVEVKK